MVKPVVPERLLAVITGMVVLAFLAVPMALCQNTGAGEAGYHNQRGMEYFKKGFYDHAPKNQVADSERNYGFAVKEFKAAIATDSSHTDAHRNLARVYHVQKNFEGAAEEYKRVTELAPSNLDAYVNLALALIELNRLEEAIQTLENAKQQTSDPKALDTLDTYISKVRAHQAKEVR
jgi:tetratricopeptide (TPR) repeat protein